MTPNQEPQALPESDVFEEPQQGRSKTQPSNHNLWKKIHPMHPSIIPSFLPAFLLHCHPSTYLIIYLSLAHVSKNLLERASCQDVVGGLVVP